MSKLKTPEVRQHQCLRLSSLLSFLPDENRMAIQELCTLFILIDLNSHVNQTRLEDLATVSERTRRDDEEDIWTDTIVEERNGK